jgi:hypothetical protein
MKTLATAGYKPDEEDYWAMKDYVQAEGVIQPHTLPSRRVCPNLQKLDLR